MPQPLRRLVLFYHRGAGMMICTCCMYMSNHLVIEHDRTRETFLALRGEFAYAFALTLIFTSNLRYYMLQCAEAGKAANVGDPSSRRPSPPRLSQLHHRYTARNFWREASP
jgi:hypothetical protein